MIKRVLIILLIFMAISLVALWFITGGVGKIKNAAGSLGNPIDFLIGVGSSTNYSISLPWQPKELTQGADLSNYSSEYEQTGQLSADQIQSRTDDLQNEINQAKTFGNPSPYKDKVRIADRESPDEGTAQSEYIVIRANSGNTGPIVLSGWSLQSVLTTKRLPLPAASSVFVLGVVNPVTNVSLNPGQAAIVSTGASPVGVSFGENMCSGYLAQFQTFYPEIQNSCPDPQKAMPETPENLQRYGAACFSYVESLYGCRFPGSVLPSSLSAACKAFVTNTYSYNGCVNMYQFRTDFKKDTWRLFLGSNAPIWNNEHDIVRLLDAEGRTVDILKY